MSGRAAASAPPGRVMVKGVVLGVGLKVALDPDWWVKHEDSIACELVFNFNDLGCPIAIFEFEDF